MHELVCSSVPCFTTSQSTRVICRLPCFATSHSHSYKSFAGRIIGRLFRIVHRQVVPGLIRADFCFLRGRAMHELFCGALPCFTTSQSTRVICRFAGRIIGRICRIISHPRSRMRRTSVMRQFGGWKKERPISHIQIIKHPAINKHICTHVVRVLCCDNV